MSSLQSHLFTAARNAIVFCVLILAAHGLWAQDYPSSVVGTDFDFITDADPSCFMCLEFKKRSYREMPDKTGPSPLVQEAFIFVAYFEDGTSIDIAIDTDFENQAAARAEAERYGPRLGKLPTSLRQGVHKLVIHKGHEDATAFGGDGQIILYPTMRPKGSQPTIWRKHCFMNRFMLPGTISTRTPKNGGEPRRRTARSSPTMP